MTKEEMEDIDLIPITPQELEAERKEFLKQAYPEGSIGSKENNKQ